MIMFIVYLLAAVGAGVVVLASWGAISDYRDRPSKTEEDVGLVRLCTQDRYILAQVIADRTYAEAEKQNEHQELTRLKKEAQKQEHMKEMYQRYVADMRVDARRPAAFKVWKQSYLARCYE